MMIKRGIGGNAVDEIVTMMKNIHEVARVKILLIVSLIEIVGDQEVLTMEVAFPMEDIMAMIQTIIIMSTINSSNIWNPCVERIHRHMSGIKIIME